MGRCSRCAAVSATAWVACACCALSCLGFVRAHFSAPWRLICPFLWRRVLSPAALRRESSRLRRRSWAMWWAPSTVPARWASSWALPSRGRGSRQGLAASSPIWWVGERPSLHLACWQLSPGSACLRCVMLGVPLREIAFARTPRPADACRITTLSVRFSGTHGASSLVHTARSFCSPVRRAFCSSARTG